MKRFLIICMTALYLLAATEAKQLLKFPVLIEHFQEHKKNLRDLSFISFIYMHYAGSDFDNTDEDRDMQLPFKAPFNLIDSDSYALRVQNFKLVPGSMIENEFGFPSDILFYSLDRPGIWQPPKIA